MAFEAFDLNWFLSFIKKLLLSFFCFFFQQKPTPTGLSWSHAASLHWVELKQQPLLTRSFIGIRWDVTQTLVRRNWVWRCRSRHRNFLVATAWAGKPEKTSADDFHPRPAASDLIWKEKIHSVRKSAWKTRKEMASQRGWKIEREKKLTRSCPVTETIIPPVCPEGWQSMVDTWWVHDWNGSEVSFWTIFAEPYSWK